MFHEPGRRKRARDISFSLSVQCLELFQRLSLRSKIHSRRVESDMSHHCPYIPSFYLRLQLAYPRSKRAIMIFGYIYTVTPHSPIPPPARSLAPLLPHATYVPITSHARCTMRSYHKVAFTTNTNNMSSASSV